MPRYYIYARYSSELQNPKSCEDQIALCEDYVKRQGASVNKVYQDDGISGRTMDRDGLQKLLKRIKYKPAIIVCEALDRLSRDQENIAHIYNQFKFYDCPIITLNEGEISGLHIGVNGYLSQEYSEQLGAKTLRGQIAKAKEGFVSGPPPFGYRIKIKHNEKGELIKGLREIDPDEAEIVREIFERYASGEAAPAICHDLNMRGIKPRRGNEWRVNSLTGHKERLTGFFHNPLYRGQLIFNRQHYLRHPETKKKISRLNPKSEWVVADVPDLRIVPQTLWDRVNLILRSREYGYKRDEFPLTSRISCGACGTTMHIHMKGRYKCPNHKVCGCKFSITVSDIVEETIGQIQDSLLENGKIYLNRLYEKIKEQHAQINAEIQDLNQQINRLLEYVAKGSATEVTHEKIQKLDQKVARLKLRLTHKIPKEADLGHIQERLKRMRILHQDVNMQQQLADIVISIVVDYHHGITVEPNYEAMFQWLISRRN